MRKVYITPKIKYIKDSDEVLFFFDSRWRDLFQKKDYEIIFYHADLIQKIKKDDLVIFSGGNNLSVVENNIQNNLRDELETTLYNKVINENIKHLGICRGAQFIYQKNGGVVQKIEHHAGTSHRLIYPDDKMILSEVDTVLSHHDFGLKLIENNKIQIISFDEDNFVEAFKIEDISFGLMWHPERQKDSIQKIFINYLNGWLDE